MYDAVVFDNDGVLVEPPDEADLVAAARRTFESLGVSDPDHADVSDVVVGVTPADVDRIADHNGLDPDAFRAARDRHAAEAQLAAVHAGKRAPTRTSTRFGSCRFRRRSSPATSRRLSTS